MKKNIKYSVEKSKSSKEWIVWKNIKMEKSIGSYKVYQDVSKEKCYEYKNKLERRKVKCTN